MPLSHADNRGRGTRRNTRLHPAAVRRNPTGKDSTHDGHLSLFAAVTVPGAAHRKPVARRRLAHMAPRSGPFGHAHRDTAQDAEVGVESTTGRATTGVAGRSTDRIRFRPGTGCRRTHALSLVDPHRQRHCLRHADRPEKMASLRGWPGEICTGRGRRQSRFRLRRRLRLRRRGRHRQGPLDIPCGSGHPQSAGQ